MGEAPGNCAGVGHDRPARRHVWRLVPWRQRLSLFGAIGVMSLASAANMAIALCLGQLVESVDPAEHPGSTAAALSAVAAYYLAIIAAAYLVRESMNVLRRFLVERTCTRIDKDMYVRVVAHLMKVDLTVLAQDHIGALYGRINRSVEGLVRFLRLTFLEFVPAIFTGSFALAAAFSKQPKIALAMLGVAPLSLLLTIWQIITQKGIRLDLCGTRERMDGTVVEQLGGIDYVRAAHTHKQEVRRVAKAAERRRSKELRHHFEMSLFGCRQGGQRGVLPRAGRGVRRLPVGERAAPSGRGADVLDAVPQRDGPTQRDPSLHGRGAREQPEDRRPRRAC